MKTRHDKERADHICEWFENYIHIPKTGKLCTLFPWLEKELRHVYGTVKEDGTRLVQTWYLFLPKKNTKSTISAGCALYSLCADAERSGEVYSVANDTKQGALIFNMAKSMVKASLALRQIIEPYRASLVHKDSGSVFRVLSSEVESQEGINASYIGFDELHVQKTRDMWDTLRGSSLARSQPLTVVTTTAGNNKDGIGYEIHDYAMRVLSGKIKDPTFHVTAFCADEKDDPHSVETHKKANPSYGLSFTHESFQKRYKEAKESGPAAWESWQRYHLNIWKQAASAWLPAAAWADCGREKINSQAYIGQPCFAAFDLSSTTDLTALSLLFKRKDDKGYDAIVYHWMPRGNVLAAEQRDKKPYRKWAEQGYLELTEGTAIDHTSIGRRIIEIHQQYPFVNREVACDDYNAWQMINQLAANNIEAIPVSQKARGMNEPSKQFLKMVMDGHFHHGGNPLLDWEGQIVEIREDDESNIRPWRGRGKNRKRIDGIVCCVMSVSQSLHSAPQETVASVYESRGVRTL